MEKVRIQDDLYTYVNQEKLDQLVIPDDKPSAGGFNELADSVEKTMMDEYNQMSESGNYPNNYLKNSCTLYQLAKNVEKKEKDGVKPALDTLKVLEEIKDFNSFSKLYKSLVLSGLPVPFKVLVETNMENTSEHCVLVQGPSTILPDASYYKEAMAQQKQMILGIWTSIAKVIISKTDLD